MSSPLPVFTYLVALNNAAADDPGLITSVASPGTVGAVNVWTDVTSVVQGHTITRGRQHELDRFEAGTCTLTVDNRDARFNPWNSQGPYAGLLVPMKQVQVRATYNSITYKLYTGHINAFPIAWPDNYSSTAQLQANDAFRLFNLANITNSQYAQTVLADSPVSYYRMDETGPLCLDSSGNGHNGIYVGKGTQAIAGALVTDPDLAFDTGSYLGYVTLPATSVLGNTFTVEAWMQFHAQPTSQDRLYSQADATDTTFFVVGPNPGTGANISLALTVADATHVQNYATAANLPISGDGKWHHVVFTRSGSTFQVYLDGVSQPVSLVIDTGLATVVSQVRAGLCRQIGFETPGANAAIDEVATYNSVLSAARVLAHYQAGNFPAQTSGARLNAVLTVIGWSAGARNIDTGTTSLGAQTASLTTTKALAHMQLVEQTEDGALFMTGDGKVRFISRTSQVQAPYNTSQATYGDNPGQFIYQPGLDLALDDLDLFNQATVQNANGIVQQAQDVTSVAAYGLRTQSLSGLLGPNDAYALARAQWLVARFKQPVPRLRSISVYPLDNRTGGSDLVSETLGRELLDRITVLRFGAPGTTDVFASYANIEGITDTVTVDSWVRTYALANALPPVALYGDATFGRYTDSYVLNANITSAATTLTVTIASGGPHWTTTAGDWPLSISVDSEQMTVSSIAAVSGGTQVLTLSARGINNTTAAAHVAGALVQPFPADVYAI